LLRRTNAKGFGVESPEHPVIGLKMEFQRELDARGLNCPLPILKTKKALAEMKSGEVLRVLATDPGSVRDFQAFARQTGNQLLDQSTEEKEFIFYMKRK
jgi:tRNA 2-thiouridine synthesizing protein A